jgi:hypothetical protein
LAVLSGNRLQAEAPCQLTRALSQTLAQSHTVQQLEDVPRQALNVAQRNGVATVSILYQARNTTDPRRYYWLACGHGFYHCHRHRFLTRSQDD